MFKAKRCWMWGSAAMIIAAAPTAWAHPGHLPAWNPLLSGLMHPLHGADHLLAVIASGLLAARIGTRAALWVVPGVFVLMMWLGSGLAMAGIDAPAAHLLAPICVFALALAVTALKSVPLYLGLGLAALAAAFHGHVHVTAAAGAAPLVFMAGLSIATVALQVATIAAARSPVSLHRPAAVRWAGAAVALAFTTALAIF